MCIRDSEEASQDDKKDSKSKTSFFGKKKKEKDKFEQQIEELTDRLKPVSYTHLDISAFYYVLFYILL